MDISLSGRSALITGGSKGLGLAMAAQFAASGADVAMVARGRESLDAAVSQVQANTNARVIGVAADVSTPAGVQDAYDRAMAAFGKLDILVNNAGTSATGPFEKLTDAVMQADLDLKLFAAIRFCRLVWPQMKERRDGRIVNVLAVAAKAPRANSAPTSVSRAAGMAFMKALSNEGAPHNIRVNAMLVGLIDADQHVEHAKQRGLSMEDYKAALSKEIPLGRFGRAEEFANLATFLVSDAGSYITGTAINVDGGRSPVV